MRKILKTMNRETLITSNIRPSCHRLCLRLLAGRRISTNVLVVLGLLLVALGVLPNVVRAESASFYLSPGSGTFFVESSFDVSVFVNSEGNSINAVQVDLKFSPDKLQVVNPTTGKSFISVWADQPFFSNKEGLISFKGGVLSSGIKTSGGLVSAITFRAKAPGKATLSFLETSKILKGRIRNSLNL